MEFRQFPARTCAACIVLVFCLLMVGTVRAEYEPTWESLERHEVPEWFRDAKLGIYTHWGAITWAIRHSEQSFGWYGMRMYKEDHPAFEYHREHYGDQDEVGYKDLVPRFKTPAFDADRWASLFKEAGARFAGPVAVHHDNYLMWDSELSRWNAAEVGPERDITGELAEAIRERDMKFIASFHHGFSWRYYEPAYTYDAGDPQYSDLYCEPHESGAPPTDSYQTMWLDKVKEAVNNYSPSLIWFDFGLGKVIQPEYQRRMFAFYYNWALEHDRLGVVTHKHGGPAHGGDIHQYTGVLDFERGRSDHLTDYPWLTDTSIGPWYHHKNPDYKSTNELVDILVDIVSKNGCMLLNVGPDARGRIPKKGRELLRGLGGWLDVNGDAIYGTRPWKVYGEGPTHVKGGAFIESEGSPYTPQDLRFTQSKDGERLYVIALGWPGDDLTVRSMQVDERASGARIELLGREKALNYHLNDQRQPVIEIPKMDANERPCEHACAFRLTGFEVSLSPQAVYSGPDSITLNPKEATLEGERIRVQDTPPNPNVGYWDKPEERIHWLVEIPEKGSYRVAGEFGSAAGASSLELTLDGQSLTAEVPQTEEWASTKMIEFGELKFGESGVYHLVLQPADPDDWEAVNVHRLQLAPRD